MSAPSAHPIRSARHPSLSSPMCLSPQPTLNLFSFASLAQIDTVMFSSHKSFTGFRKKWERRLVEAKEPIYE